MKVATKLGHVQSLLETAKQELHDVRPHNDEALRDAQKKLNEVLTIIEQRVTDYYVSDE